MIFFDITELLHHGPEDILISVIKLFGALIILMNVKPQMALLCFAVCNYYADLCTDL